MKTKEINVWVDKEWISDGCDIHELGSYLATAPYRSNQNYKCIITIEIPEKKVTITESELESAYNMCAGWYEGRREEFEKLKKELGF